MGCGACMQINNSSSPILVNDEIPIILQNWINKYINELTAQSKICKQPHPILSLVECRQIKNLLASSGPVLPAVSYQSKQQKYMENVAAGALKIDLLTSHQRIIWKCLLFIPDYLTDNGLSVQTIRKFSQNVKNQQQIVQHSFYQIQLDVNRTFPMNKNLNKDDLSLLLRNVVNCFPGIGYTQGMNFYAGFLLLCGFTVEQSYYLMIKLFTSQNFLICHNFSNTFSFVTLFNNLLANQICQQLSEHLNSFGINQQIYSFSWFLCVFLYNFQLETCTIFWDWYVKSGASGLSFGGFASIINASILIMKKIQPMLKAAQAPDQIMTLFRFQNINKIINQNQMKNIVQQIKLNGKMKLNGKEKSQIRCFTKSQICSNDKQLKDVLSSKQKYTSYIMKMLNNDRQKQIKQNKQLSCSVQKVVQIGNYQSNNEKKDNEN